MSAPPRFPMPGKRRPRIFYGWYIVAATVAMNLLLSVTYFQGFQAFFLPILGELGWSRTLLSGAFSMRQIENGLASPVVGLLVDRFGARKIILVGVILGGLGMAGLSRVSDPLLFYFWFAVISAGVSGPNHSISWAAAVSNWFHRLRGRALGIAFLGPVLSGPFVFLVVLLEQAVGWRQSMLLLAGLLLALGIPLALVARHRPEPYGYLPDGDQPAAGERPAAAPGQRTRSNPESEGWTVREAVRTRAFWVLAAIYAIQGLCHSGLMAHVLPLFQSLGFSAEEGAMGLGAIFFLSAFGRIAAGFLTDYFDRRQVLAAVVLLHLAAFVSVAVMSPPAEGVEGAGKAWLGLLLFALLYGVAFGSAIPARPLIVRELFGSRAFSTINGLTQGANFSAGVMGPLVMGISWDLLGTYRPGIILFGVLMGGSLPLLLALRTPGEVQRRPG